MFKEKIQKLADLRKQLFFKQEAAENFRDLIAKSEAGKTLANIEKDIDRVKQELSDYEATLRTELVEYIAKTGDSHPHSAVMAKRIKKLEYDPIAALTYCTENKPELVKIDLRKGDFEKYAKANSLDFVSETEEITVAISKNLNDF